MSPPAERSWDDLDPETRDSLDAKFLEELRILAKPGLTEEGVEAYLEYRRDRPDASLTTYDEGQLRYMLRLARDPSREPDPVEQEEHVDRLEVFGAERLHLTNLQTYSLLMFLVVYACLLALILLLILR